MALVVTIVVLLILAGITITYVFGDNGIFKLAQKAKDETENAIENEKTYMNDILNNVNEYINGIKRTPITDVVDKMQETTIIVEDKNGNPITIPGGFKVVPNSPEGTESSTKVDYTYNGDGTPAVQDGIVIEDEEGNQFVWIPIGEIKNKDNTTTPITLGRYSFANDGTPTLEQAAYTKENLENYMQEIKIRYLSRESSRCGKYSG